MDFGIKINLLKICNLLKKNILVKNRKEKKSMKNYIYKIKADETDLFYIGSTKKKPNIRFNEHKSSYKTNTRFKSSSSLLFEKYPESVSYEILEEVETDDIQILKMKESEHIKNNWNKCLNKRCPVFDKEFYNARRREKRVLSKDNLDNQNNQDNI
jgi:hypothetical protein